MRNKCRPLLLFPLLLPIQNIVFIELEMKTLRYIFENIGNIFQEENKWTMLLTDHKNIKHYIRSLLLSSECKRHIQTLLFDYTNAILKYVNICNTKWRCCWNTGSKFEKSKDEIIFFYLLLNTILKGWFLPSKYKQKT